MIEYLKRQSILIKAGFIISGLLAILFLCLIPFEPYPFSYLLKIAPLLYLFLVVSFKSSYSWKWKILLAAIFCMIGDILLDVDRVGLFRPALAAFLLGHCFYVFALFKNRNFKTSDIPYIAAAILYSSVVLFLLRHIETAQLIPVIFYVVAITALVIFAKILKPFSVVLFTGTVLFLLSDSIIAINKFVVEIPFSRIYNMGLYDIAQYMIIFGFLITEERIRKTVNV